MRGTRGVAGLSTVVIGMALWVPATPARAANSPTYRDCSAFTPGFDPDFVQISDVTVAPDASLTVAPGQKSVQLLASESSDPGDSAGHVTLSATVTAAGVPTETTSGTGTGQVVLQLALLRSGTPRTYTISWAATFDSGNHACPSTATPANTPTDPHPYVVSVASRSGS